MNSFNDMYDYLIPDAESEQLRTPWAAEYRAGDCAVIAIRHARYVAQQTGNPISHIDLDHSMSMVVNGHDDIQSDLRQYAAELASIAGVAGASAGAMARGYVDTQLWAQSDPSDDSDNPRTLDADYSASDVAPEYLESVTDMFAELIYSHPLAVRMYLRSNTAEQFGADFYLTREHHGAGFWDRGIGDVGRYLTGIAHAAGSAETLWDNGAGVLSE